MASRMCEPRGSLDNVDAVRSRAASCRYRRVAGRGGRSVSGFVEWEKWRSRPALPGVAVAVALRQGARRSESVEGPVRTVDPELLVGGESRP